MIVAVHVSGRAVLAGDTSVPPMATMPSARPKQGDTPRAATRQNFGRVQVRTGGGGAVFSRNAHLQAKCGAVAT